MTQYQQNSYIPQKVGKKPSGMSQFAKAVSVIVTFGIVGLIAGLVYQGAMAGFSSDPNQYRPSDAETIASMDVRDMKETPSRTASSDSSSNSSSLPVDEGQRSPNPIIAQYKDVLIHSPIAPEDLEAVLFHQASFESALVMTTRLPEASVEGMEENPDYKISDTQPGRDGWLDGLALHLWREDASTEMDTSIDVGAEAGDVVYAPVTGTVVRVSTYNLYDVCEDYDVHIEPDGHPELDVVEIHIYDVKVKEGDHVEGGVTPMAKVRDLAAEDITDIQLAYYTTQGHGNHTHVQVNNAEYPGYRESRLQDREDEDSDSDIQGESDDEPTSSEEETE